MILEKKKKSDSALGLGSGMAVKPRPVPRDYALVSISQAVWVFCPILDMISQT